MDPQPIQPATIDYGRVDHARALMARWKARNQTGLCQHEPHHPCNKSAGCALDRAEACVSYIPQRQCNHQTCNGCRANGTLQCRFVCWRQTVCDGSQQEQAQP